MISRMAFMGTLVAGLALSFSAHGTAKRYIVQFKSPAAFEAMTQEISTAASPLTFTAPSQQLTLFGNTAVVAKTLKNVKMLIVESEDAKMIQAIQSNPAVALVEEEFFHPAPEPIATQSADRRAESVLSPSSSRLTFPQPWGIAAVRAPQAWTTTRGRGARVMVLDTGIDRTHPALASRIEAVQNFTGGSVDDVKDDVGHGSHVSGTILADGLNGGLVGVAPEAKVLMAKVCSAQGCSNVAIASGLDWAVSEKVDVVNMSLGGMFMSQAEATAVANAEAAGVMIVAASGNDGKPNVSYPGADATVLAVGAVDVNLKKADFSNWGPELAVMGPGVDVISSVPQGTGRGAAVQLDLSGKGLSAVNSLPFVGSPRSAPAVNDLVFANFGTPQDFASLSVKGKFALISRGTIPFKEKVANAIAAGAAGVLIYNNADGLLQGTISADGMEVAIPAAMIEQTVGESAKAALLKGQAMKASLGVIASDYASFQGTSMATPHVTGVAALVRAANKALTPQEVRDILKKTATPLTPNDQNQMGAGIVNAEAAVAKASSGLLLGFLQVGN